LKNIPLANNRLIFFAAARKIPLYCALQALLMIHKGIFRKKFKSVIQKNDACSEICIFEHNSKTYPESNP